VTRARPGRVVKVGRISFAGIVRDTAPLKHEDLTFIQAAARVLGESGAGPRVVVRRASSFAVAVAGSGLEAVDREGTSQASVVDAEMATTAPGMMRGVHGGCAGFKWDPADRSLLMFRDPLGRRPLFYSGAPDGGALAFSSLMAPLLCYPGLDREPDLDALAESAVFGFPVTPGSTAFRSVRQVVPGMVLEVVKSRAAPAGQLLVPSRAEGVDDDVEGLSAALGAAIQRASDGAPGQAVLLSGGLDSSLVAALAAAVAQEPGTAYTLVDQTPEGGNRQDVQCAHQVASDLDWSSMTVPFDDATWLESLVDVVLSNETFWPASTFNAGGDAALYAVGKAAAQANPAHSCLFTGDGGDELFGGYWMHRFPLGFVDRLRHRADRVGPVVRRTVDELFPLPEDAAAYEREIWRLLSGPGLYNDQCWCVDRTARRWNLPLAAPYLDDAVVSLAAAVPAERHRDGDMGKALLRSLARKLLPPATAELVATRPKMALPSAAAGAYPRLEARLERLLPPGRRETHPYRRFLLSPLDVLSFDLWYALFVTFAGEKPDGLSARNLYQDWSHALPREGPDA